MELRQEREVEEQREVLPEPVTLEMPSEKVIMPIRLTSFLPRSRSKVVFVLVMACYCIVIGSFVSMWASVAGLPRPPRPFYLRGDVPDVFAALVLAPLIESLFLVGVFELVRRVRAPEWVQVFTSALFISELHVWPWWPHALIVLAPFVIQAASYLYWRRTSRKGAFWVLVCIHTLNNVIPALSAVGRAMRHT